MIILKVFYKIKYLVILRRIRKNVKHVGKKLYIRDYYSIYGQGLIIKDNVAIGDGAWLAARPYTGNHEAELIIGNGCNIGRFNEIYATKQIILEDKVLTAERVYISDNIHGYQNPDIPIMDQPIVQKRTVRIGEGSWLGVGVAVIGANIGKHCIIGANAVVTHDIPDYSVAVGIPARVIKKYDAISGVWVNV